MPDTLNSPALQRERHQVRPERGFGVVAALGQALQPVEQRTQAVERAQIQLRPGKSRLGGTICWFCSNTRSTYRQNTSDFAPVLMSRRRSSGNSDISPDSADSS